MAYSLAFYQFESFYGIRLHARMNTEIQQNSKL